MVNHFTLPLSPQKNGMVAGHCGLSPGQSYLFDPDQWQRSRSLEESYVCPADPQALGNVEEFGDYGD